MPPKGTKQNRRKIDNLQTLKAFETRLKMLPDDEFNLIRDKWLCAYCIWDTVADEDIDEELELRYEEDCDNHVWRICKIARERSVPIRGVTSCRVVQGVRIAAMKASELEHLYYVGGNVGFGNTNRTNSVFCLLTHDKRYIKN